MRWMPGQDKVFAYGSEHGYLVLRSETDVRLSRFSIELAARDLSAGVAAEVMRNVIVFPLGRGPGRPGGEPELAALMESAKSWAERYEGGEALAGYPAWQQPMPEAEAREARQSFERRYPPVRLHYHEPLEIERECRELHELPAGDPLADLRAEDGHVPDYNRAEANRRLSAVGPNAGRCPGPGGCFPGEPCDYRADDCAPR